ncbi:MAG: hypothetical protein JST49_10605 [Bacteroidetes bacterium]|nr:hypothetical protein [Bacteroidota bacterium]
MEVLNDGLCKSCGAPLKKINLQGRCQYCNTPYSQTRTQAQVNQPSPTKSIDAIRTERDAEMYIGAAKKAAYVFAATVILMLILSIAGVEKNSTIKTLGNVVLSTSLWAAIILYIIGRVKRSKAKRMR